MIEIIIKVTQKIQKIISRIAPNINLKNFMIIFIIQDIRMFYILCKYTLTLKNLIQILYGRNSNTHIVQYLYD